MDDSNSEYSTEQLKQRFCRLWEEHLGGKAIEDGCETWDRLARQYSDPVRHYHTLDHLAHCLRRLDDARRVLLRKGLDESIFNSIWQHLHPSNPTQAAAQAEAATG